MDSPLSDPREALIARHLGVSAGRTVESELAKLHAMPAESREAALARLAVIDELQRFERHSLEDADRAAKKLGMSRRNLYRLIGRLAEHGPALGLAPYARRRARVTSDVQALGPTADAAIAEALAVDPNARIAEVFAAVRDAYAETGEEALVPSWAAIRRRLTILRRPGSVRDRGAWLAGRKFGQTALIDQTAVEAKQLGVLPNTVLVFVVDTQTRLVLGCGHTHIDQLAEGLFKALADTRARARSLVVGGFPVSDGLERVRWIVPDELAGCVDDWDPSASDEHAVAVSELGPRRHGQRLVRLLGTSVEPFQLRPRVIGEKGKLLGKRAAGAPVRDLTAEVHQATDNWNYRVLEAASGLPPTTDPQVQQERLASWRALQSAEEVKAAVLRIIGPLEAALQARLQSPARTS